MGFYFRPSVTLAHRHAAHEADPEFEFLPTSVAKWTKAFWQSSHASHWCRWQSEKADVQVFTWNSGACVTTCSLMGVPAFWSEAFCVTAFRSVQFFLTCMTWVGYSRLLLETSPYLHFSYSRYDPIRCNVLMKQYSLSSMCHSKRSASIHYAWKIFWDYASLEIFMWRMWGSIYFLMMGI